MPRSATRSICCRFGVYLRTVRRQAGDSTVRDDIGRWTLDAAGARLTLRGGEVETFAPFGASILRPLDRRTADRLGPRARLLRTSTVVRSSRRCRFAASTGSGGRRLLRRLPDRPADSGGGGWERPALEAGISSRARRAGCGRLVRFDGRIVRTGAPAGPWSRSFVSSGLHARSGASFRRRTTGGAERRDDRRSRDRTGRGRAVDHPARPHHGGDHGGAGHHHRQRGAAADGRQPGRHPAGDQLGQHRLHPVQRRRAADDRVLHRALRPAAVPHGLDHPVRRRLVPLRHVALARGAGALAHRPGRGRRGAALHRAGDDPPDLPPRAAGAGPGDLPPGHHRGADARPDARRLDHRQLHLELVLLHQRPDRDRSRPSS